MPKLNAGTAKKVEKQEVGEGGLKPLPTGTYPAHLVSVESKEGGKGPYWKWTFELDDPEPGCFTKQYMNTSLTEASLWKLKEVFSAFGVASNTDTDELCGEHVLLAVVESVISSGPKQGQPSNDIDAVLPYDED